MRVALGVEGDHDPALVLFTLPILLSAYVGGLGPGLVSTAIAAVGTNYLVLPPVSALSLPAGLESAEWLGLIVVGVVISFLNAALRWSRATAEAAERRYAVTLASIGDAVIATDVEGRMTFVNRAAERLTGIRAEQSLGQPLARAVDATDAETQAPLTDRAVLGDGASVTSHPRLLLRPGEGAGVRVESIAAPIRNGDSGPDGFVVILRDRAEQDAAEDMRREMALQRQLSKIAGSAPGAICAIRMAPDATTISIPYASAAIAQICGVTSDGVRADASAFFDLVDPDDAGRVRDTLARSAEHLSLWRCQFRVTSAAGDTVCVESNAMPEREADGGTLWHGFLSDVTDRHEAEVALREQLALVDLSSDAVFVRAADTGALTSWSTGAHQLYGWSAEQALDRLPHELLSTRWPEGRQIVRDSLE
ncbi:MAG: PAS domain S-box protein, partial [Solirubrobacteraceae bacterium]